MSSVIALGLGSLISLAAASPPPEQARPPFEVFADLGHTGTLTGPLTFSSKAAKGFGIAAPLPTRSGDRGLLREKADAGEQIGGRLGRLRVKTTMGDGDVDLSIECENRRCLRLFRKSEGGWRRVAPKENGSWTLAPGAGGMLELGIGVVLPEASSALAQTAWPHEFTAVISTKAQRGRHVRLPFRVAPFIIPSALDPVEELLIVSLPITDDSVSEVREFAEKTGLRVFDLDMSDPCDQWMQDTMEPGIFAFPTALGGQQARASLTGLRKEARTSAARLDYHAARWLRRRGVATVAPGIARKNTRWIDWYGNLEATPPYTDRQGQVFPFGRIITGKQRELAMHPGVMGFLEAQGVQWPPITVDTTWLLIGHVDEVVNFVPAKGKPGFKVLLPSPKAARDMLEVLLEKGLQETPVFAETEDEMTLGKLRMTIAGTSENLAIDDAVSRVRALLKRELNLLDSDFVMLPALFQRGMAVIPNAVNSAVVNGHLLVPAPRGPRHDEKDAFEEAIRAALAGCDVRVMFIDSWNAYHTSGGEIHCGTNTFRRLRDPAWWTYAGKADKKDK
jgi:Protein-arginine deiminase (PAD)